MNAATNSLTKLVSALVERAPAHQLAEMLTHAAIVADGLPDAGGYAKLCRSSARQFQTAAMEAQQLDLWDAPHLGFAHDTPAPKLTPLPTLPLGHSALLEEVPS